MSDLCPVAVSQDSANLADQPKTAGDSHLLLLKQKKYCDVTFTFPNLPDRIAAHGLHLKARSPVFEQIFRMRKSGNVQVDEIEISESTPEIFQQFLEFIYIDKFEVDIAGALELLQLAQKYKVHPLTDKCEELLRTEIKAEESVKVFEAARRYGHQELMDRAGDIMVKSFRPRSLAKLDGLMSAAEGTVIYLLERDDLGVQEVGLFAFILDWGRKQVGTSAGEQLLKDKLKNVISKIRYTNMTQLEFTTVVVPTGFLSAEETVSVYSYICGDEVTRRGLKIGFNTTRRKAVQMESYASFYFDQRRPKDSPSAAVSKQLISFKVERTQTVTGLWADYLLKKAIITKIRLRTPFLNDFYKDGTILQFYISIREHSSPAYDTDFTIRFQEVLFNPKGGVAYISVDPPVELIPGKTFSIIVKDLSTSDLNKTFRNGGIPYEGMCFASPSQKEIAALEEAHLVVNEIQRSTEYYSKEYTTAAEIALICGMITRMV